MRFKTIAAGIAAVVLSTMLVPIALSTPAQAANHIFEIDSNELRLYGDGDDWHKGAGGKTGINGFWYTYSTTAYATWDFGYLKGVHRPALFYPWQSAHDPTYHWQNRRPTASPRFEIRQCNSKRTQCKVIRELTDRITYADGSYKQGWLTWNTEEVELDGYIVVKVQKRFNQDSTRLAADSFRLEWIAPLLGGGPPGVPQNLRIDIKDCGKRVLVARWDRPSANGGSAIGSYTVRIFRPGWEPGPTNQGANSLSHTLTSARAKTTYTFRVVATNSFGSGPEARASYTTPNWPQSCSTPEPGIRTEGSNISGALFPPPSSQQVSRRKLGPLSPFYQDLYDQYNKGADKTVGYSFPDGRLSPANPTLCDWYRNTASGVGNAVYLPKSMAEYWQYNGGYYFYLGECTSWVQFRLVAEIVRNFDNKYLHNEHGGSGVNWGNADNWDDNAKLAVSGRGVTINKKPKVHAVAQWDWYPEGHVAFVEAVSKDRKTVWVSEMNIGGPPVCYMTVRKITFETKEGLGRWPDNFIHFSPTNE